MAMTLPITSSPSSSAGNSPASVDSSVPPQTPITPVAGQTLSLPLAPSSDQANHTQSQYPQSTASNGVVTQVKRKPSRRANTAERRATHNAVERQRRETLNGRFLDLAALLPNLSQIRRPSKSAIVNSSIAHVHASRRHRSLASRELRALKSESDALRRELNEWRERARLPCVEEPIRGEGFSMILNGEVEALNAVIGEEDEGQGLYEGYEDGEDEFAGSMPSAMGDAEDSMPAGGATVPKDGLYGHENFPPTEINIAHLMPRGPPRSHGPIIAQMPSSVSFENPDMPSIYEPQVNFNAPYNAHHPAMEQHSMKAWAGNMYNGYEPQPQQFHQLQVQRNLVTPPSASHNMGPSVPTTENHFGDQITLGNLKRQHMIALQQQHNTMGYTADAEDASSVGSGHSSRERSGSFSPGSGYCSPTHGVSPMNYEVVNPHNDYGFPKRLNLGGIHISSGSAGPWNDRGEDGIGSMMTKQGLGTPIIVGSGGYNMMI